MRRDWFLSKNYHKRNLFPEELSDAILDGKSRESFDMMRGNWAKNNEWLSLHKDERKRTQREDTKINEISSSQEQE